MPVSGAITRHYWTISDSSTAIHASVKRPNSSRPRRRTSRMAAKKIDAADERLVGERPIDVLIRARLGGAPSRDALQFAWFQLRFHFSSRPMLA